MESTQQPDPASPSPSLSELDGVTDESIPREATALGAKADLGKRFIAALIDSAIAFVLGLVPVIGGLIGAAYFVVRDGLELDFMDRRSIGKNIMKLRPVRLDGKPMDIETSFRRNWMFGLGAVTTVLAWIPILGWLLMIPVAFIALGIGLFEIYKVVSDAEGRRWGDNLGKTKVVEVQS